MPIKVLKRWNTLLRNIISMKRGCATGNSFGIRFPLMRPGDYWLRRRPDSQLLNFKDLGIEVAILEM